MGFGIGSIGGFFKSAGTDIVHGGEHLWHTAVKGAKTGAHAVATVVRSNDAAAAKGMSWLNSGEQYVESKTDQARAWLRQHGGIAGKAASDYLGFTEGADKAVFDTAKGLVQLGSNVQQLGNPLEWAANPGANIARLKAGAQAAVGLSKLVNLTQPASWAADPQGNAHMVGALWHSAVTNFKADPSKSAGYVAGTIATFFVPGGGEEAAAGDLSKVGELGADGSRITAEGANAARGAGDNPTVWVQHGPGGGPIREYQPGEVSGNPDVGSNVSTPNGDGTVVSRGEPPNKPDVHIAEPDGAGAGAAAKTPKVIKFNDAAAFKAAAEHPEPNATYQFGTYSWTTDASGRTIQAEGEVVLKPAGRSDLQTQIGHEGEPTDVGFHLIGDQFNGPTNRLNVVQGNGVPLGDGASNLNQGAYGRFEKLVKKLAADPNNTVEIRIRPQYDPGNLTVRPDDFQAAYRVKGADGKWGDWITQEFVNKR